MVSKDLLDKINAMSNEDLLDEYRYASAGEGTAIGFGHAVRDEILRRMRVGETPKGVLIHSEKRISSISGEAEVIVSQEPNSVAVIPLDDCHISVVWSDKHKRLIAIISEIPTIQQSGGIL